MATDGRYVTQNWPGIDEIVWVPILDLPWRDDDQDRKPEYRTEAS